MIKILNYFQNMNNFFFENKFYLTTNLKRQSKHLYLYEQLKKIIKVKGDIIELGVFKGASLSRIILFSRLLGMKNKIIYGFDVFKKLNKTKNDFDFKDYFDWSKNLGSVISKNDLLKNLNNRKLNKKIKLIDGDVRQTLPKNLPKKICFVNLDLDIYDPTDFCLPYLWNNLSASGIILLDNFKAFKGETDAVNKFIKNKNIKVNKVKFGDRTFYFLKK